MARAHSSDLHHHPAPRSAQPRPGGSAFVPVLATYFSVRRGRDPFFKFFMRTIFPRQVREYEQKFGIRFIGWYNVAYGWDFDNVILMELPDYGTIDKLEKNEATRNDLLGELAADAALERTDFIVQATEQLRKFLDSNAERIEGLGGLTLI